MVDQFALGREIHQLVEHRIDAVGNPLNEVPLGGIGNWNTDQRLKRFDPVKRQPQIIAPHGQYRTRAGAILLAACRVG